MTGSQGKCHNIEILLGLCKIMKHRAMMFIICSGDDHQKNMYNTNSIAMIINYTMIIKKGNFPIKYNSIDYNAD
jgi:hypothetical protein